MITQRPIPSCHHLSILKVFATLALCLPLTLPLLAEDKKSDDSSDSKTSKPIVAKVIKTEDDKDSPTEDSAEKSDSPKDSPDSQFKKNTSPSGLQIGMENSDADKGLPENVTELAKEGAMASANKDWKAARDAYLEMTQAAPDNALALSNLGIVEYRLKDYENATLHLEQSVKINPSISQNWLTLGLSYYYLKQFNLAISSLTRARHEDPKDPRTCLYLAVVIRDYGWGRAAETELMRAIALDPDYADAHFNLALLYLERNPPAIELARRHYFSAIDLGAQRDEEIEKRLKNITASDSKK